MEKEDSISKSKLFHILLNDPDRVRFKPKTLYEGGQLDSMKNRIYLEQNGEFIETSFHHCEKCPKSSLNRLIFGPTLV